jgi:hypothetical protein
MDKQKAAVFAEHRQSVFQLFPSQLSVMEEETINNRVNFPHQMALPMRKIRIKRLKMPHYMKSIQKSLWATT